MRTWTTLLLALCLTACGGRIRNLELLVDQRILAADIAWQNRDQDGLRPLEGLLDNALRKEPSNPDFLWRQTRMLVERGLAEEAERRVALDTYGMARSRAVLCLNELPAWRARRTEVGLASALEVVDVRRRPCVAWGALAWARWIVLMGGDAAALDLNDVALMADWAQKTSEVPAEVEAAQWAAALVQAVRPESLGGSAEKAARGLKREVKDHPNDLARRWDLLTLVAIEQGDTGLATEQRHEIAKATARTEADRAIQARAAKE